MASQASTVNINVPSSDDMAKLLACNVHLGARTCDSEMERYVWKRNAAGVHLINLQKTYEKIVLAARMIVAIEEPSDVCIVSARPYGQRAILKFSTLTGAKPIAGRFTPGTFTNQIQAKFIEPRLLIVTDPRTDAQALLEASYANIPSIAICHTDSSVRRVDCAIPGNNKAPHSIGLIYWLLCREVLRLRGKLARDSHWDVMVDLFFYRDPDHDDKSDEVDYNAPSSTTNEDYYPPQAPDYQEWDGNTAPPSGEWGDSAVPSGSWDQTSALGGSTWEPSA